jgi:formate hydrogenlyase subunit 3/multisubunit Na+/H+ antiporter MnhD subunit
MTLLLVGVIGAPLLAGLCLIVAARWLPSSISHWIALVVVGVAALCALGLIPYAGQHPAIEVTWLPGMGAMTLELGATSLYAAAATTWAALLALLATPPEARCPPLSAALVLITLAAATVAFVAGHFLLRYAALEIVALGVAVAPFVELRGGEGARLGRLVYLLLRVGDAGLLAAILILFAGSGTLEIGPALQAGLALDETGLRWAALGLVLAVWVKSGGWPFSLWLQAGSQLPSRSRTWLYATVMPNLGLYLLYRVTPLLAASGPVRGAALWIGAGSAMLAAFVVLFQSEPRTGWAGHAGRSQRRQGGGLVGPAGADAPAPAVVRGGRSPGATPGQVLDARPGRNSADGLVSAHHLLGAGEWRVARCHARRRGVRRAPRRVDCARRMAVPPGCQAHL